MKNNLLVRLLIGCWLSLAMVISLTAGEPGWRAGTARANITPEQPMWLAGYGTRTNAADGKLMDLWIKVLVLEDADGHRGMFLTSDLLGIPQSIYQHSCEALKAKFNLAPEQIVLSASHTHCGPVLRNALYDIYPLDDHQRDLIEQYSEKLEGQIVETVGRALADLSPVTVGAGQGAAGFAVNRRNNAEKEVGALINSGGLKGPVDHAVPVLAVYQPDGSLKAVLCGYACHNTTTASNEWCGDYCGFAQMALEKSHPGAQAMFFMGCGGDQNPEPRGNLRMVERYGNMLAAAVEEVLLSPPQALPPKLETKLEMISLHLGEPPTEKELVDLQTNSVATNRRWATRLLGEMKAGKPFIREYPYPVQVWKLGDRQVLVTLGGEAVVDYALKFKHEFGEQIWVAAYCNDVMTYIPSLRVLREDIPPMAGAHWGYEGHHALHVYGLPADRWGEDVEDLITGGVQRLMHELKVPEIH